MQLSRWPKVQLKLWQSATGPLMGHTDTRNIVQLPGGGVSATLPPVGQVGVPVTPGAPAAAVTKRSVLEGGEFWVAEITPTTWTSNWVPGGSVPAAVVRSGVGDRMVMGAPPPTGVKVNKNCGQGCREVMGGGWMAAC